MKFIKNNRYILFAILIVFFLVCYSFYQHDKDTFGNRHIYYKIKKICYEKGELDNDICRYFRNRDDVKRYLELNDPVARFKKYDAITLTSTIVELTIFGCLQFFSPLIIAIAVIGTLHDEFSSGMFQNYLLRMDYKKYLKQKYKVILKSSLIMPLTLIFIFIVSCFATKFNFDISNIDKQLSVYDDFKYNNFFIYGIGICLIQFFMSWFYSNIALFFCKKHTNKLVAIVMSYVGFLMLHLFIYLILYCLILNRMFGIKEMTDYFTITGYWFFDNVNNLYIPIFISFLFQLISTILLYLSYRNKNGVIDSYERQTA